jgi:hypothetical protein
MTDRKKRATKRKLRIAFFFCPLLSVSSILHLTASTHHLMKPRNALRAPEPNDVTTSPSGREQVPLLTRNDRQKKAGNKKKTSNRPILLPPSFCQSDHQINASLKKAHNTVRPGANQMETH